MNTETKRHIDSARQVLVGVVPNPTSQIDQITNALIYKFMDDMDQAAIKAGGDSSFFVGDLEKYAWTRLMDSRLGNQERMNLYSEALLKFSESKQLPELFRGIFKSAFLPYRSPETLGMFLKEINYFDYSHPEELGNAYEYLLSIMSSQGDAGQFRTPRHIIDFIVEVVNPTKDDKVLDPACGTAGFLISAYKHILKQHDGVDDPNKKEKPLTPDQRKNLFNNFEGYDIDPGMVRIAEVNMYLHQFKNPKIFQYDSLSMEDRWNDKFDVIMANPPFMSPKGGIKPHTKFSIQSSRSEVLFVDYIINHLRPKGRAGVIVPEGIIFQSGTAYKQLRKNLIEDGLYAVVSLPSGVFNPYAGVKTSILLFDNEISKKSDHILFIKIQNDGFDLGAQRRLVMGSDLPLALEVLLKYKKHHESNGTTSISGWPEGEHQIDTYPNCFFVSKKEISKSGDYNLSGDRYRVATDYSNTKWPMVELREVCSVFNGYAFKSSLFNTSKKGVPVIRIRDINTRFSETYYSGDFDKKYIVNNGDLLIGMDGDFIAKFWDEGTALLNQRVCRLEKFKNVDKKFIYYLIQKELTSIQSTTFAVTVKHLSSAQIEKIKIPFPPLEIQKQVVTELDGYQNIIAGAKQIVTSWKPKIDIDPEWETVKLGDVCETTSGGTPLKSKSEYYENGTIPWLRSGEVAQGFVRKSELFITEAGLKNSSAKMFPVDTILVAMYGATAGQVGILKFESSTNQAVCGVLPNNKFVPEFLFQILKDQKEKMVSLAGGGAQPNISQGTVKSLEIRVPPLEIQKQIVEKIKAERILIESAKKLIEVYEQKTKDTIAKLWGE